LLVSPVEPASATHVGTYRGRPGEIGIELAECRQQALTIAPAICVRKREPNVCPDFRILSLDGSNRSRRGEGCRRTTKSSHGASAAVRNITAHSPDC
jgi:hypothetical protein